MSISEAVDPTLASRSAELTQRLSENLARVDVPGAAFALARGDELVTGAAGVLSRATGYPVTADSYFQIGSVTKLFTATLVMQLVDEGQVELDEPVRSYLPGFDVGDEDASAAITVRHLLTHTSGIQGDYFADFGRGSDAVARYVASLRQVGMLHKPGELFSYCNSGFSVLGLLLETLRGTDYGTLLTDRLLQPLGIAGGTLPEQAILHRAAIGHVERSDGVPAVPAPVWALPYSAGPAGSTPFMDAAGLVSFARMHLASGVTSDGTRLLSEAAVAEMQRLQAAVPSPGSVRGIGASWALYDWAGGLVPGHDGGTRGQYSFLRVHPASSSVVVLLTNGPGGGELFESFAQPLFAELTGLPEPEPLRPTATPPDIDLARLAGTYQHHGVDLRVRAHGDRVTITAVPRPESATAGEDQNGDLAEEFVAVGHSVTDTAEFLVTEQPLHGSHQSVMFPAGPQIPRYLRLGSRVFVRAEW
jgi:CubicO group peptidase (beta-lactamase class C family)